jgi:hypothetical protein
MEKLWIRDKHPGSATLNLFITTQQFLEILLFLLENISKDGRQLQNRFLSRILKLKSGVAILQIPAFHGYLRPFLQLATVDNLLTSTGTCVGK